ncbi:MAG: gamma carbonic anhydrase family protein [Pseudomonadota bacterium]
MTIRDFQHYHPRVAETAYIDPSAVVIGNVTLADDVSIWPLTVLRGDVNSIQVGARSNIQDRSVVHVTHYDPEYSPDSAAVVIGDDVTVGHGVILHGCTIGNRCLIGMGSTLLDGVVIEDEVMVGANSLVPMYKTLESGYLYLGSPVQKVRALKEAERAFLKYSAMHYVELKNKYGT